MRQEDEDKLSSAIQLSPTRRDFTGSVTFIGKQEYDDEVLRSHYLMSMIRSKEGNMPPIQRGDKVKPAEEKFSQAHRAASLIDIHAYKGLIDSANSPFIG